MNLEQPPPEQTPDPNEKVTVAGEVDFEELDAEDQERLKAALHEANAEDEGFESLDDILKKLS